MPRAVVFTGAGEPLNLLRYARPEPAGAEVLVRVACCTLCRSDLHTHAGRRIEPTPIVLGHEIVGRIDAFGPEALHHDADGTPLAIGDRVSWSITAGCGDCFYCANDLPQKCERLYKYGHQRLLPEAPPAGGLSDYAILVRGTQCYRVPDSISDATAASANCSTATVAAMLRHAGNVAGRSVLVLGAGVLGLTACAMASAFGAKAVIAADPVAECRERSKRFGATLIADVAVEGELAATVSEATAGRGADVVLELSGRPESVEAALSLTRTGGVIVLAGTVSPVGAIPFDPEQVVRRLLTIHGVHNYHPRDLGTALAFLAGEGARFPWQELVAATFPLEQIEAAFTTAHTHPGVRVAIMPASE